MQAEQDRHGGFPHITPNTFKLAFPSSTRFGRSVSPAISIFNVNAKIFPCFSTQPTHQPTLGLLKVTQPVLPCRVHSGVVSSLVISLTRFCAERGKGSFSCASCARNWVCSMALIFSGPSSQKRYTA